MAAEAHLTSALRGGGFQLGRVGCADVEEGSCLRAHTASAQTVPPGTDHRDAGSQSGDQDESQVNGIASIFHNTTKTLVIMPLHRTLFDMGGTARAATALLLAALAITAWADATYPAQCDPTTVLTPADLSIMGVEMSLEAGE